MRLRQARVHILLYAVFPYLRVVRYSRPGVTQTIWGVTETRTSARNAPFDWRAGGEAVEDEYRSRVRNIPSFSTFTSEWDRLRGGVSRVNVYAVEALLRLVRGSTHGPA